jgi:DnaD/phage-associated family protein
MSEKQSTKKGKTIFRVEKNKDNPFVMIDRRPIENTALSWRAKGVLTYLVSRPDNWTVRLGDLVKRSPDGVYAVRAALKELKKAGHITRREERENGRFKQYVLEVHELPITSPLTNLSQAETPQAVDLTLNDTDSVSDTDSNNIQEEEASNQTQNLFMLYAQEIGLLTPLIADAIEDWEKSVPEKWVRDAISEAAKSNARNWKYVEAILKRWKAQGNQEAMRKPARANGKTKANNIDDLVNDLRQELANEQA